MVATTGLSKGKLSDGTSMLAVVGVHNLPKEAMKDYSKNFYNSCFTYNEYHKTIKNQLSNTFVVMHPFKHSMLTKLL